MGKTTQTKVHKDDKIKIESDSVKAPRRLTSRMAGLHSLFGGNLFAMLFFAIVWVLLAFRESALLFRMNELSVFLYDDLFYEELMSMPAGILYYVASWFVQFFYYPVLGATIYVALLALVYWLTCKVFDIAPGRRLLAMLPVVALLASNTQLGYWIFYIKTPGYYYVALLGVLVSLLAMWAIKRLHVYLKPFVIAAWIYFAYPCLGVYALVSGVVVAVYALCEAIHGRHGAAKITVSSATVLLSVIFVWLSPGMHYGHYVTVPSDDIYTVGVPSSQWKSEYVPDNDDKEREVSVIEGINGCVGYPVNKVLTKFRINIDGSFSQKAINTAKDDLFTSNEINRPSDGKRYTFTFVGKDGAEYYLNAGDGDISVVAKENGVKIPESGHFVCVVDGKYKDVSSFKTADGKYLVWRKMLVDESGACEYAVDLSDSPSDGNVHCSLIKMLKEDGVRVGDNSELFGLVYLMVLEESASGAFAPLFVAGIEDGAFAGSRSAIFNDSQTSALRVEEVGYTPKPFPLEMQERSMWFNVITNWIPFILLLLSFVVLAVMPLVSGCCPGCKSNVVKSAVWLVAVLLLVAFSWTFWYGNENFRVENEQNRAMWNEDWNAVAELSRNVEEPTRQIVMNRNIALLKLGRSGNEMFSFPEGSADIEASVPVRLAQTGGKMAYFQYGKFNFCYRWCVEDAVEYGWRIEYLKHAVRSMLLSGEYRLAQRYIDILKRTWFYADWACEMEEYVHNTEKIARNREFTMPLNMTCYNDFLDVDESYVEAYLTKNLTNATDSMSRFYVEAAMVSALTRKDAKSFWFFLNYYVNELKANSLPRYYQEAVLLFLNVDKGRTVQVPQAFIEKFISVSTDNRMKRFMQLVSRHKGESEEEMAPYFKDDFGDSYFYFYFFVRNIKTN